MAHLRSALLTFFLVVGMLVTSSVFAYGPAAGSYSVGPGPTTLSYLGTNVPCFSTFTVYIDGISGDSGLVIGAAFGSGSGGSGLCPHITASASPSSPWSLSPATFVSAGIYTATVSGISLYVPPPINATCTGSVTVTLNQTTSPTVVSFNGTLHNGPIPCGVSGTYLYTQLTAP